MGQERKLVTVLFADIVGSTTIVTGADPEVVRETLDRAFDALQHALVTHGASVEKFIGDAVMAVFGVPAAHEDDADRAVRAAFACRDAIGAVGRVPLELRIGVNTGEVVAGGPAAARVLVTGEAVNLGARLQQSAAVGEILVGPLTYRLTGGSVRYGTRRALDAKGIGQVECWPAEALVSNVPEPRRGLAGLRSPLIGREREMGLLRDAYSGVRDRGKAYLVTVFGPAGSGKSRLAEEFLASIGAAPVRRGRCLPYGEAITFYPLQLILRADAGIEPDDTRELAAAKLETAVYEAFAHDPDADAVLRRVNVLAGLARGSDALKEIPTNAVAEELRWGIRRYLEVRAGTVPLTLALEDIHWAEPALLDLVEHLAEWSRAPLLILCLARPEFRSTRPEWGARAANATAIDLSPLARADTLRLITELTAVDALPDSLRREVVTRSEGNPLYVEEFLRVLIDRGQIGDRADRMSNQSEIALGIPPTLLGLIAARLDHVTNEVRMLLQRASLAGRLFSTAALAALTEGDVPRPELLADAIRRDLLVEVDESAPGAGRVFRFKHVLIRDVAYGTLSKAERSRLHDRYGRWLEETFGERRSEVEEIIAFHAEQAYLFGRELDLQAARALGERAFVLLRDAARSARFRGDLFAARSLYERARVVATDLVIAEPERIDVEASAIFHAWAVDTTVDRGLAFTGLVDRARQAGRSEALAMLLMMSLDQPGMTVPERQARLAEAVTAARAAGDPELVAEARLYSALWSPTPGEARRILGASLAEQKANGAQRSLDATLAELGRVAANMGDFTEGLALREEALRIARQSGAKLRISNCIWTLSVGLEHLGDLSRALALEEEALALSREMGSRWQVLLHLWTKGVIFFDMGDHEKARIFLNEALDLAVSSGETLRQIWATIDLTRVALAEHDAATADRLLTSLSEATWRDSNSERFGLLTCRAELSALQGEDARAEKQFRQAIEDARDGVYVAEARRAFARFLISRGRGREARAHVAWLLNYYRDPVAKRRYDEAVELERQCNAVAG